MIMKYLTIDCGFDTFIEHGFSDKQKSNICNKCSIVIGETCEEVCQSGIQII